MKTPPTPFETLVDDHCAALYHYALAQCGRADLAWDLVQETFRHAWAAQDQLTHMQRARAWLFTILRRAHAGRHERQRPQTPPPERLPTIAIIDHLCEPDAAALLPVLEQLTDNDREPLLQLLGGFSCAEIADMLGITGNTVSPRLYRARRQLRSALEDAPAEVMTR